MITASYLSTTHFLYAALSWLSFKSFPSLFIVWKLIRLIIRIQWREASRKSIRSYTEDWTAIDLNLTFIYLPRLFYRQFIEIVKYMISYLVLRLIANCRCEETSAHPYELTLALDDMAYLMRPTNPLTFLKTHTYRLERATKFDDFCEKTWEVLANLVEEKWLPWPPSLRRQFQNTWDLTW